MVGYLEELNKVGVLFGKKTPKGLFGIEIVHDDDCRRPNGFECTCKPEFIVKEI